MKLKSGNINAGDRVSAEVEANNRICKKIKGIFRFVDIERGLAQIDGFDGFCYEVVPSSMRRLVKKERRRWTLKYSVGPFGHFVICDGPVPEDFDTMEVIEVRKKIAK